MAKAFISEDANVADEFPLSQEAKVLNELNQKNKQATLGSFNSNKTILNSPSNIVGVISLASVLTGGARNPLQIGLFSESPLFVPKAEQSKLSRINAVQYTYQLNGYVDYDKISSYPAGISSFTAPIYFTLSEFNFTNALYDNAIAGGLVRMDKFITINSFKIGTFRFNTTTGLMRIEDNNGNDTMVERIDWTVPIDNRPIAQDGGDFFAYDFINTDPKKITVEQLNRIKEGRFSNLVSAVTIDMTGQTTANTNFVNQIGAINRALRIYGHVVFEIFGLAVSYTPEM